MNRWTELEQRLQFRRFIAPEKEEAAEFWAEFRRRAQGLPQDAPPHALTSFSPIGFRMAWIAATLLLIALLSLPFLLRRHPLPPMGTTIQSLEVFAPCTSAWILTLPSITPHNSAVVIWISGLEENPT